MTYTAVYFVKTRVEKKKNQKGFGATGYIKIDGIIFFKPSNEFTATFHRCD